MSINVSRDFVTELLKDLVYPEVCPFCSDIIPTTRRIAYHRALEEASKPVSAMYYRGLVCDSCLSQLDFVKPPYCRKCGKPLSSDADNLDASNRMITANDTSNRMITANESETEPESRIRTKGQNRKFSLGASIINSDMLCSDCRTHERSFTQCRAVLGYDERMRDIMADIKYNGRREYLKLFGLLAADRLGAWIKSLNITCLIPVPVHASRLLKRGYNQSELLCQYISNLTHIPVRNDIIIRNKKTTAQKELNVDERLLNLQSAFKTARHLPPGSIALIVDDIYTTGSTMESCTERIMEAGAVKVYGLTICIGEDKGRK